MEKRQIVNIVNFIRACEPRLEVDLYRPVREQIALMERLGLKGTFLLQYDALIDPEFITMMRGLDPARFELGVWHEIVEPECLAAQIPWTGRFPWDWHTHCGFSVGYTKPQREQLCDVLFGRFREVFGYYPRVFGSWLFDSHTLRYLSDRYGLDAACSCKDQYGTDGYTLWGGYYGQAYYPGRANCFMPAQSPEEQLPVPVFRMLGSDPVYQYDLGVDLWEGAKTQGVVTLEPVYTGSTGGGGVPNWVDWFLRENFSGECLSFGYAQAGQENAFGWERMKSGLEYQFRLFRRLQEEGRITVERLGETGRWYRETFPGTPASAITAHSAFDDAGLNSVWYSSRYYRINLYGDGNGLRIRDLHLFTQKLEDPFENCVCLSDEATYESVPLIDGNRQSGNGVYAGIYFELPDGRSPEHGDMRFTDQGGGTASLRYGATEVILSENGVSIRTGRDLRLRYVTGKTSEHMPALVSSSSDSAVLSYRGIRYRILLRRGRFDSPRVVRPADGKIEAVFEVL